MEKQLVIKTVRSILSIEKDLIGIRTWKQPPEHIPRFTGNAFPGLCTQIGEVLTSGATFYTDRDQCFCSGGMVSTGAAPPLSAEERHEMLEAHFSVSQAYRDVPTALRYEEALEGLFEKYPQACAGIQVGPLGSVDDAELAIVFCTPAAADILSRTYCYITGEPVRGFGGNGACPFLIRFPFVTGKPFFSYSDVAWRKYVGLAESELTVTFPYETLVRVAAALPEVAQAYRRYGEPPE
jgi:uncharacterized protein (DUF169 family)